MILSYFYLQKNEPGCAYLGSFFVGMQSKLCLFSPPIAEYHHNQPHQKQHDYHRYQERQYQGQNAADDGADQDNHCNDDYGHQEFAVPGVKVELLIFDVYAAFVVDFGVEALLFFRLVVIIGRAHV